MANTIVWNKHDYVQRMRRRINALTCWSDVLNVKYSNVRTIVNGSMSTEPATAALTRGSAYSFQDFTLTADTLTISTGRVVPMLIDEADRYQQNYIDQMKTADFQGKVVSEYIESAMLAAHASWTDFGATDLTNTGADDTTQIAISVANIDDVVRAVKRKINTNNGTEFAVENGIFMVWRPEDFEMLEAFCQANGFTEADVSLKNGIPVSRAFRYLGVDHYMSTKHTANHVFAGIKKMGDLGILRGTYGRAKFIEDPGLVSGLGIVTRVDFGFNWAAYYDEFFVDINVA